LWGKLVVNAAINPITALLDVPNGYLLENPSARMIFGLLADETAKVANEIGIALPYKDPKKYVGNVIKRTSKNSSSMRQDLYRLAPTEVEAINGAVVRMAAKAGIQAPFNQSMYSMIKARLDVLRNINGANNQQGG
jgi:2-dehydropantoate 2-reductase